MTPSVRAALVLACVTVAAGQYECPSGSTAKSGSPMCAGATDASCTNSACCSTTPQPTPAPTPTSITCADYSGAWVLAQVLAGGCMEGGATKFFDLGKSADAVASPQGDDEIKAACCTDFSDAMCHDWNLMICPTGTTKVMDNSAPGGGSDGKTLSQSDFETECCTPTPAPTPAPLTCASFQVAWVTAQLLEQGCYPDSKFFDTKLTTTSVSSSSEADVKAACCTDFSDAKCSDWVIACNAGYYPVGTNSAPPDSSDGTDLSQSGYQAACCREPISCAAYGTEADSALQGTASILVAVTWASFAMMRA